MPLSVEPGRTQSERGPSSNLDEQSAKIKEHERLAAVILDGMYQFVALLNPSGDILEVNRAALEGAGHQIEEIRGKPFWTARWWQVSEQLQEDLKAAIYRAAAGEFIRSEVDIYGEKSGLVPITIDFSLQPIRGESGEVEYLLAEGRNITERKLAEEKAHLALSKLRKELLEREHEQAQQETERRQRAEEASALLAAIVQSSGDAIISKDLNAIITSWNRGAERIFGYKTEEVVGQSVTILMPPERLNEEPALLEKIRSGQRIEHYETVRRHKNGTLLDISLTISPVFDSQGRIIGASKIARDISDRKRLEATLLKAHGLGAAGRMAASIAHEINNPLEAVTNLLYLMRSEMASEIGMQNLSMAEAELARVAQITRKTLAYYRDTSKPEPVDLTDLITDTLFMFAKKIDEKRITVVRTDDHCTVHGFKGELQQVFSNLFANAIDAAGRDGRIEFSCHESGGTTVATVHDNGIGIPSDLIAKLFEPFFTTKEQHMGTGLGLWISKEIAQKHGAEITVESSTDASTHGTTFTVTFSNPQRAPGSLIPSPQTTQPA
jgi:PAS domain S-box-containing protein